MDGLDPDGEQRPLQAYGKDKNMHYRDLMEFYKGKRVFVTGHTGFKGSWLCRILIKAGAYVTGYSLEAPTDPSLFEMSGLEREENFKSVIGDVRNFDQLFRAYEEAEPEIVFHLAAQPIVIRSYQEPLYTYETNVMGTVNLLECIRRRDYTKSVLNVTTDKVYYNDEQGKAFTEDMPLDGYDPYSNSKSCSELATHSYRSAFLKEKGVRVSTARAGNVIGGGDFAENRIVPDCVRAALKGEKIIIRNPYSVRPFQHVLEPLFAYMLIAKRQLEEESLCDAYNVGPDKEDCVNAGSLADIFCKSWQEGVSWVNVSKEGPHEAGFLQLDCGRLKSSFGWRPVWNIGRAIEKTVEFSKGIRDDTPAPVLMEKQIEDFLRDAEGEE